MPLWAQKLLLAGPQPGVDASLYLASPVHVLQLGACSQAWGWPGMGWLMLVVREESRLSEDSRVPFNQRGHFEIRTMSSIFGSISPDGQRPKLLSSRCPLQTSPTEEP